jgi:hypothetical protein
MVKKYIKWIAPETAEAFTHTEIWKSTNQGVSCAEFTTANDPLYGADGMVITAVSAVDLLGAAGHWYKIRFYDNVGLVWGDYSEYMRGDDFRGYCTILDVRNYTNVQTQEYSDAAIQMLIDTCTSSIDVFTGRTWQGVVTVTDAYLDGNGRNYMQVDNDLQTVTSLAIDQDGAGTYTTIATTDFYVYTDKGAIYLDQNNAAVKTFVQGRRSVKVSYTHGNADPTDDVRHLAILMVANMMKMDNTRTSVIEELKNGLRIMGYVNSEVGSCDSSAY